MISTLLLAAAAATFSPQAPDMNDLDRVYSNKDQTVFLEILEVTSTSEADVAVSVLASTGGFTVHYLAGEAEISALGSLYIMTIKDSGGVTISTQEITEDTDGDGNERYRLPGATINDPDLGEHQNPDCNTHSGFWSGWVAIDAAGKPKGGGCPIPNGSTPVTPGNASVPTYPVGGAPPQGTPATIRTIPAANAIISVGSFNPVPALPNSGELVKYPSEGTSLPYAGQRDLEDLHVMVSIVTDTSADGTCKSNATKTKCSGSIKYRIVVKGGGLGDVYDHTLPAPNLQHPGWREPSMAPPLTPYPTTTGPTAGTATICTGVTTDADGVMTRTYDVSVSFTDCGNRTHRTWFLNGNHADDKTTTVGEPWKTSTAPAMRLTLTLFAQCNSCKK